MKIRHSIANHERSRMEVFSDEVALQSIKPGFRILYERAWKKFKEFSSEDFATTKPSEQQLFSYFNFLRESGAKSKTLWTTYSMLNSIIKAKYGAKLQDMPHLGTFLKSFDGGKLIIVYDFFFIFR